MKKLGVSAFYGCTSMTDVRLSAGLTAIGGSVFQSCEALKTVTIPVSVTSVGHNAFGDCAAITKVYYSGTESQWNKISFSVGNEYLTGASVICGSLGAARKAGDINGDGSVDNNDLVTMARYIVGLTSGSIKKSVEAHGDMNGDGRIDNADIVIAARVIVGL